MFNNDLAIKGTQLLFKVLLGKLNAIEQHSALG